MVLKDAIGVCFDGAKAYYYLGNLYYDKLQFDQAITLWEESEKRDDSFPTVHRNLAIAYYNKKKDPVRAQEEMERLMHWMRQIIGCSWNWISYIKSWKSRLKSGSRIMRSIRKS